MLKNFVNTRLNTIQNESYYTILDTSWPWLTYWFTLFSFQKINFVLSLSSLRRSCFQLIYKTETMGFQTTLF